MKKFLRTTAAVLVLLLVCFAGYVQYRKWSSFQTPIPKNAAAVIRVNAYSIIQTLIPDYLSISRKEKKEELDTACKTPPSGIELPANLFIYTVSTKALTTFFTRLEVNDVNDFKRTITRVLKGSSVGKANPAFTTVISADRRLTITYTNKFAALAWSLNPEPVTDILSDILLQKNVVAIAESPFRRICDMPGHMVYLDNKNQASVNFGKGSVTADAVLQSSSFKPSNTSAYQPQDARPALYGWLHADVGNLLSVGPFTLRADSFLKYYNHKVTMIIDGTTTQQEMVITYGYNDNFEKVEKSEVRNVTVPLITLQLSAKPQLYAYLVRQGIIQPDSGTVSRSFFPLYQLYGKSTDSTLVVSTGKDQIINSGAAQSTGFANLDIRFDAAERQQLFPLLSPYIHALSTFTLTAKQVNDQRINVHSVITFDNRQRNALLQLADNF